MLYEIGQTSGNWLQRKKAIENAVDTIRHDIFGSVDNKYVKWLIWLVNRVTHIENALKEYKMVLYLHQTDEEIIKEYTEELKTRYKELKRLLTRSH